MAKQHKTKPRLTLKYKVDFKTFRNIRTIENKLARMNAEIKKDQHLLSKLTSQLWYAFKTNSKHGEVQQ